ncbi:EAL domain-containing protein [Sporosarcina sp. PTS2304]|uniref:bifunctional diguanylate cyclase/phosphodiesterase n=1 Tax=Sporosarcina sp. PTS2304 TaxID=2283194 RepID=UPI0013B362BD|nr:EAL domain-containing protein [Sporosarcina sp. PTS2304]
MSKKIWLKFVLATIVLTFIFLNTMDYQSTKKSLKTKIEEETINMLNSFIAEVDRFSSRRMGNVKLLADYIPYIVDDENEVIDFLRKQHEVMDYFSALGFITPEGKIVADDGSILVVKEKESLHRALNGEIVISDVFSLAQNPDIKVSSIVSPVRNENNKIIGVVSGLINIQDVIQDMNDSFKLPGSVYFIKNQEVIYSYPTKNKITELSFSHAEYIHKIEEERYGTIHLNSSGHLLKYGQTETGWTVIADSLGNPKIQDIKWSFWRMIWMNALILLVGFLLYRFVSTIMRQADDRLKKDFLTGLPNRLQLHEDIESLSFGWEKDHIAVYFIRLDRFRELIEQFGYQLGDQMLLRTSSLLEDYEKGSRVYRVDYELFIFAIECDTERNAIESGEGLVQWLDHEIVVEEDAKMNLTVSVGGILIDQEIHREVLENGAFACQESSRKGGNQFTLYDEELSIRNKKHRQLVRCLSTALERQEFYMVYQPIYSISEQRIVGFESLIRWNSPDLGEISPFQFIPILETDEAIVDTGRWIMHTVANQANEWSQAGFKNFTINVNVSVKQLHHESFLHDVYSMLEETRIHPSLLIFEVTESVIVEKIDSVVQILEKLNAIGIKTAIDDFGTGYSSLASLTALPFQYLKIDKAFIDDVERREAGAEAILKGIIDIAKALHQTTVMEGVETEEQLKLLKTFGAERIQGYFISKPLRVEDAVKMIDKKYTW